MIEPNKLLDNFVGAYYLKVIFRITAKSNIALAINVERRGSDFAVTNSFSMDRSEEEQFSELPYREVLELVDQYALFLRKLEDAKKKYFLKKNFIRKLFLGLIRIRKNIIDLNSIAYILLVGRVSVYTYNNYNETIARTTIGYDADIITIIKSKAVNVSSRKVLLLLHNYNVLLSTSLFDFRLKSFLDVFTYMVKLIRTGFSLIAFLNIFFIILKIPNDLLNPEYLTLIMKLAIQLGVPLLVYSTSPFIIRYIFRRILYKLIRHHEPK